MNTIKEEKTAKNKKGTLRESRIDKVFNKLILNNQKALIPFITCGYPTIDNFIKLFSILEKNGADIIEIGIPFSDPLADGLVIQAASKIALENGINTDIVIDSVVKIREKSSIPIVILTYFNIIFRYGIDKFLSKISTAGVDGLIIPDLPLEEYYNYKSILNNDCIDNIMLASLTSSGERLKKISSVCKGFLYCISVKGVTGIRDKITADVKEFLAGLRHTTTLPLALGFGISNSSQIVDIKEYCDAIIIGSKILSMVLDSPDFKEGAYKVGNFIFEINNILKKS
ncbi:MAG: tryptophan synthase subunit alpha [Actinobacteria bacterium]|nr:tryptophan synthase subunit alpha [Actinomycetota bacterium]